MNRSLRVACFSPYPASAASVRHRIQALADRWQEIGVELDLFPFMGERLYRIRKTFGPIAAIRKVGEVALASLRFALRLTRIGRYDAIIIHREAFPFGGGGFDRWIAQSHPNVIFDVDDAIWIPPSHAVDQRRWFRAPDRFVRLLPLFRSVVVGNDFLADYARQYNARVRVVPTTYDNLGGRAAARKASVPVIVWIGNWGNAEYLLPLVPVFERLARVAAFRLRLIGGADIDDIWPAAVDIERIRWRPDIEFQALCTADIGIMPLYDREHERGKCAFKIVQYFSAGIAVVASPVGMNAEIIEPSVNGFLPTTPDSWFEVLHRLLSDASLRHRIGTAGHVTFQEQFTRELAVRAWLPLLFNRDLQP